MERLTGRTKYGEVYMTACDKSCPCADKTECNGDCDETWKVIEKLADYEDLEEQGLLVKLPCKVGDDVYIITAPFNITMDEDDFGKEKEVYKAKFVSYTYYANKETQCRFEVDNKFIGAYLRIKDFGKTVFFTKSEAEQALAKMGGGRNATD
jgi:hypothetical protein